MNWQRLRTHVLFRYAFAIVSVVAFAGFKIFMDGQFGSSRPFLLLRLPVLFVAYYMGLGPGIVALLLSAAFINYIFQSPSFAWSTDSESIYSLTLYVLETSLLMGLVILLRRSMKELTRRTARLSETEDRLRVALEGSSITVATIDRNLRCQWVYNPHPDHPSAQLIGKRIDEILPPERMHQVIAAQQQAISTGVPARVEAEVEMSNGTRYLDVVVHPQTDAAGEVQGAIVAVSDITDRKKYEQTLHREEARFRELADSMPHVIWAADPTGYTDYYNRRWYELSGFPEGEFGDESWLPLVHPDDAQNTLNHWYQSVATGEPFQAELRLRDIHVGEYRWYVRRAVPVRDAQGNISRWYGSLTDIHEFRKTLDALRESEERFRSLVEATAQIVWSTAPDGRVVDMPEWRELTGQTIEQVRDYGWIEAVHPEDRPATLEAWRTALESKSLYTTEYRVLTRDGHYRWLSVRGVPVLNSFGDIREWVGICLDIEHQKRAEEQMRHAAEAMAVARDAAVQANRAKSAFLANMSHELRTPLNAILGYSEILQEDLRALKQDQMVGDAERIYGAGNQLLSVVNDLLDISKIEAGRMSLDIRPFNLVEVISDVRHTIEPLAIRNNNELRLECADTFGEIQTDPNKLRQVLTNLLSNACKFTTNGKVSLSCARENSAGREWATFAVTDTGIGMEAEDLPRLFHDFTQLDSSLTRKYGGTGLGLAICQRFASLLGGAISVESQPGYGSTFTLQIPVDLPIPAKEVKAAPAS